MDLQQRVERLERENHRLRLVALGVLVAVGLGVLWQLGVGQPHLAVDREEEACAEGMGDAQKIAEVHRLGNPIDPDCEIAAHGPSALRYECAS